MNSEQLRTQWQRENAAYIRLCEVIRRKKNLRNRQASRLAVAPELAADVAQLDAELATLRQQKKAQRQRRQEAKRRYQQREQWERGPAARRKAQTASE